MPRKRPQRPRSQKQEIDPDTTVEMIIYRARENLGIAKLAWNDIASKEPGRSGIGLNCAIIFGKSAIDVVKKLRRIRRKEFEEWLPPYELVMFEDPLIQWFFDQRSRILKTGELAKLDMATPLENLPYLMQKLLGEPPPDATRFFMTPEGSGWFLEHPDGTGEQQFVDLTPSPELAEEYSVTMSLAGCPTAIHDKELEDKTPQGLVSAFLGFVDWFINEAEAEFISAKPTDSGEVSEPDPASNRGAAP